MGTETKLLNLSPDYRTIIKTTIANQTTAEAARNILNFLSSLIILFLLIYETKAIITKRKRLKIK